MMTAELAVKPGLKLKNSIFIRFTRKSSFSIIVVDQKLLKSHKSIGPDDIPEEMIKLGGESIIMYLTQIFEISVNNIDLPTVVPIYKLPPRLLIILQDLCQIYYLFHYIFNHIQENKS